MASILTSSDAEFEIQKKHEVWFESCSNMLKFLFHRASPAKLREVEICILSTIETCYNATYINIGSKWKYSNNDRNSDDEDNKCYIWTLSLNEESKNTPLVLLHGFGCGVGLWCKNLNSLAANRPVYAIDLLGFGRSSRPQFRNHKDALSLEEQFTLSVEAWRQAVFKDSHHDSIILLGHSFGGFIAASYALKFPERVSHLVLVDPWGFSDLPNGFVFRMVVAAARLFNPLVLVRWFGPKMLRMARPDLIRKFCDKVNDAENVIPKYLYYANAQNPSGESSFRCIMCGFGWAKFPMVHRLQFLPCELPVTFLYGSESWVDTNPGFDIKLRRCNSFVDVRVVNGAGHHVYADRSDEFNFLVNSVGDLTDCGGCRGDGTCGLQQPSLNNKKTSLVCTLTSMILVRNDYNVKNPR